MSSDSAAVLDGTLETTDEKMNFSIGGETSSTLVRWFADQVRATLEAQGHTYRPMASARIIEGTDEEVDVSDQIRLVVNLGDMDRARPVRRSGQGTFVVTVVEGPDNERDALSAAFPVLVRSLSNMVVFNTRVDGTLESHFITIEQGHYTIVDRGDQADYFRQVVERIQPLACSHLVINNEFIPDLPKELWQGDAASNGVMWAGAQLDKIGLLPNVVPIASMLTERDMKHIKRLYQMGGLSYGNLSARALHDPAKYWMSASGVDKSKLSQIGRDVLLVTEYVPEKLMMRLSVPPEIEPKRVSVDAIEHWMIYREHPAVGAIIHIHAWWKTPIQSTQVNYPCGTYELASEVAELVRREPDPSRAVIGLKNHGLTITGHSIEEIFARIEGMIVPQVPMS